MQLVPPRAPLFGWLGKKISREYTGRRLDVIVTMDRGFVFVADLIRGINARCQWRCVVRSLVRLAVGVARATRFGCGAMLESGVTQDSLLRRLRESRPLCLRLAVLLDKPEKRHMVLEPDYFGLRTASNRVWAGYGLAGPTALGEITDSFLQERTTHPGRVEKERKRKHDRSSVRLQELERET